MQKSEMSSKQLFQRNLIVESLSSNGWKGRQTNQIFDNNYWVHTEAIFDYKNTTGELTFQFYAEKEKITLSILEEGGRLDFLIKRFDTSLKLLIDQIVSLQETLKLKSFKKDMISILNLDIDLYILDDEDNLLKVSKSKSN